MKKIAIIVGVLIVLIVIISKCRGNGEEEKPIVLIDPPTDLRYEAVVDIEGSLSEYMEIVPGSYLFEIEKDQSKYSSNYRGKMNLKIKFIKPIAIKSGTGYNHYGPSLKGKVLEADGIPLDFCMDLYVSNDLAMYLKRGSGEEWITVKLGCQGGIDNDEEAVELINKFKKGKKIRLFSEVVEEKIDPSKAAKSEVQEESNASDDEVDNESKMTNNCDEFLKGYEKFVDEYVAVLKKMKKNPNDLTVLTEYSEMMIGASEWTSKIADCQTDSDYIQKFTKIQMKMATALSEMQ